MSKNHPCRFKRTNNRKTSRQLPRKKISHSKTVETYAQNPSLSRITFYLHLSPLSTSFSRCRKKHPFSMLLPLCNLRQRNRPPTVRSSDSPSPQFFLGKLPLKKFFHHFDLRQQKNHKFSHFSKKASIPPHPATRATLSARRLLFETCPSRYDIF